MLKISYIVSSFVMPLHKSGKGTTASPLSVFFTNTHTIFFSKINVDALEYERTPKNAPGRGGYEDVVPYEYSCWGQRPKSEALRRSTATSLYEL